MIDKTWAMAKQVVIDNKFRSDWVTTLDIYHFLGGLDKRMYAHIDNDVAYRVLAILNDQKVLVMDTRTKDILARDFQDIYVSKKVFTDNPDSVLVIREIPDDIRDLIVEGEAFFLKKHSTTIKFKD